MSDNLISGARSFGAYTGGRTGPDANDPSSLAFSGNLSDLMAFAAKHPDQRGRLEDALVANGRFGDLLALNRQAPAHAGAPAADPAADRAKGKPKPDYDTPFWTNTKYGSGPTYRNRPASDATHRIAGSAAWDGLVANGSVSASEKRVVSRMADNEGRLDSVQAWDNQIVTAGAMQKTVNPTGSGELAKQVYEFSQSNPADYQRLFADRGWTVAHTGRGTAPASYLMSFTADGKTMTGRELADYLKDEGQPAHWTAALDPLLQAGRDPTFGAKQIGDFVARLDTAMGATPTSQVKGRSYTQPIGAYATSEQGAGLVLDESVNRPAHVPGTFGKALDRFAADHPKASLDPTSWTAAERAEYEPAIMANYKAARDRTNMTDPDKRAQHIIGRGTTLSAEPGSFERVAR